MESGHKETAKFTAPRALRIVSPGGDKCMNFKAGETRIVHKDLFSVAIAAGCMPEESLESQDHTEAVAVEEHIGVTEATVNKSQKEQVEEGLLDACKTLIARGDPNDFTQLGQPRAAAVKKLVDFDFTANDVRRAFEQAMFEVENDGDESEEPAESSSSAAE